ncbi:hypothetical protein Leryth_000536 [Lithospermum erythrorhizon]|nr:hypothetical protein Leryth_000536 [Lithospermum erythrorhizon]
MFHTGLVFDVFPLSRLITFCALHDHGDFAYARSLFSLIPDPNTYIWNTLIRGGMKRNEPEMGLRIFKKMVWGGVEMDKRSFVFALKCCERLEGVGVEVGRGLHGRIWKLGFVEDLILRNGLVHFYGEMGFVSDARKVFDEISDRDVVSWTTMIDGYVKAELNDEALEVFKLMCEGGVEPNEVTMITVFSACGNKGDLSLGLSFHELVCKKRVKCGLNLSNAMLDMYAKCGRMDKANDVFDRMERRDVFTWTSMIDGYGKNGEVDLARKHFDEMPGRNVVSWNAMIAGYSQNNRPMEAIELFRVMESEGMVPIESTLVCVLSACAQLSCLTIGQQIHKKYVKQKWIDISIVIGNALIDMYAKCGCIYEAEMVFRDMPAKIVGTWNSMILGYASNGSAKEALSLFEQMVSAGSQPDSITFVGILSACAHGGLIDQGFDYFRNMETFGLIPKIEHYACMTDLLGRLGRVDEAHNLIKTMTIQPDEAVWGTLLSACRMCGNVELGKIAADKLIILDPKDSGTYALLASLCSKKSAWGDVSTVRSMMREKGIKKNPGCSSIEVEGRSHGFLVADQSHPHSKVIYKTLDGLRVSSKPDNHASDAILTEAFSMGQI